MSVLRWFAEAYHWTPEQVGSLTLEELHWLPLMKTAFNEAVELYQESKQ